MTSPFGGAVIDNPVDQPKAPSSLGYWLGGLLIVLGIVGAIVWGVVKFADFSGKIDDFERVPVGEVGTVDLDEGDYVVYAERGGGLAQSAFVGGLELRPADGEGDEEVICPRLHCL